jgi:hypothetical protein
MAAPANDFYKSIPNAGEKSASSLVDYFVYFLTTILEEDAATASSIRNCFNYCDLIPPARLPQYLSDGLKTKPPKFIKVEGGYRLQRHYRERLAQHLNDGEPQLQNARSNLRRLEVAISPAAHKIFLSETIACLEIGAYRAAIVMCWLLALDHLFEHILKHGLSAFNAALSKNTDKRVKITSVSCRDDFGEIPESKFIEFCRSANIVSNDIRKILDHKLGVRNSAAHPSTIKFTQAKTVEYIEDLVENVVLRYKV